MERSQTTATMAATTTMAPTGLQRDAATRLHANYSDDESETSEAATKRREAAAGNVNASAMNDEDAELDDFALSSDDEDAAMSGKEPALDRAMMNELLLVCSNLGMLRVQNEGEEPVLMRGEDCEEWIHDLQRAIRRDHAKHKLVAKQLGKWKILQKKLLPLLINHQHDWSLVFSILKVLVMLTMKPTKESTNIAQQLKYLRAYKYAFLQYEIVPILMTILVDPLSRKGSARTAQDYLNMELVLTLVRNVLAIPNEDPRFVTSTTTYLSHLHEDFIQTLHEENVYEMILLFAQDIESAENREWNLLIMEMMDLTLDCSHPKAVAAFAKQRLTAPSSISSTAEPSQTPTQRPVQSARTESLTQKLNSEKLSTQQRSGGSRRHSNFGGVLTLVGPTGRSTLLTNFSKAPEDQVPQAAKKPVARKRGGRQRAGGSVATDISEIFGSRAKVTESDQSTMSVLMEICDSLISKSYFQLTNSLKNEFRRGSSKLVSTDRLQYFHLVWFLTTYHRLKLQALKSHYRHQLKDHEKKKNQLLHDMDFQTQPPPAPEKPNYDEKAVLSTLDMFSFNFILQSIETYASVKNYHGMTVSVQLLTEMMAYLSELGASDDPRYQRIADSLQHKILYERDFLDRIPVLLKTWSPGIFSKEYVMDVVTLSHLVFKMLDAQGTIKVLSRRKAYLESKKKKNKKADGEGGEEDSDSNEDEEESERQAQLLLEMQRKEADFDVRKYFQSILSSDTIKMYCFLLSSYRENSTKVNHYIHSFFYRAKHFKIQKHEEWTMQPLLFNIHVLLLFNKMLQDPLIQKQSEFKNFLDFIRGVVRDFFTLAEKNHLLFVEALLRQPYAAKTAMLLQRNYEPLDTMAKSRSEAVALGREKQIALINEVRRQKKAIDAEELEGEEEFQFTLQPSDFQSSSLVAADKAKKSQEDEDSGSEEEVSLGGPNAPTPSKKSPSKSSANAAAAKKKTKAASERAKNWTKVEDRYLEKMFMKYRHLPSVYEVISYEDMFQDRDRTAEQIERRVKYLKLHRKTHDSSDEDEKSDGDDDADTRKKSDDEANENSDLDLKELTARPATSEESSRPRRRLRRVTTLSDDSNSDDDLLGGGSSKQTSPRDELPASPSPARANDREDEANSRDSLDLSNELEETEEFQDNADSGVPSTDDPTSRAQEKVAGEQDPQVANEGATEEQADASISEDQTHKISQEGSEMIGDGAATQAIDHEDDAQLLDGETEVMNDDAPAGGTEVGDVEDISERASPETAGVDAEKQSAEESVDANMTEVTDGQEDASVDAESAEPTSNKRRRDGDDELHDDLITSTSPQQKVARVKPLEDDEPPAEEN